MFEDSWVKHDWDLDLCIYCGYILPTKCNSILFCCDECENKWIEEKKQMLLEAKKQG